MRGQNRMVIIENCQQFKNIKELEQLRVSYILDVLMKPRSINDEIRDPFYILQMLRLDVFKKVLISSWITSKTLILQKNDKLTTVIKSTENIILQPAFVLIHTRVSIPRISQRNRIYFIRKEAF